MIHIEIHYLETARDAALLATAGLPRYDLEPSACAACKVKTGEVESQHGTVVWRPFGVVLDGDAITTVCRRCLAGVDKALKA